jgi:hypothetical protein
MSASIAVPAPKFKERVLALGPVPKNPSFIRRGPCRWGPPPRLGFGAESPSFAKSLLRPPALRARRRRIVALCGLRHMAKPGVERLFKNGLAEPGQRLVSHTGRQFAFPNHEKTPAQFRKFPLMSGVPRHIASELRLPEAAIGLRRGRLIATMAMPEAAAHLDDGAMAGQHDVRMPRQRLDMKAEPKAGTVQPRSHQPLRPGVLRSDATHDRAATFFRHRIHHRQSNRQKPLLGRLLDLP